MARAIPALAVVLAVALAAPALAQEQEQETPPKNKWSFAGPFGKFDRGQLQRGLKVYREVCQTCHGITLLPFRALGEPGGPELTTAQAAAIAAACAGVKPGPLGSASVRNATSVMPWQTWQTSR